MKISAFIILFSLCFSTMTSTLSKDFKDGNYTKIVNDISEPQSDSENLHVGLANYCLFLKGDGAQYFDGALVSLTKASKSDNNEYRAKALLHLGYLIHSRHTSLKQKRQALAYLHEIQTIPALKNTTSYNDSLLYSALIYKQMGWYVQARSFYRKLSQASLVDNKVYDPEEQMDNEPLHAGRLGLNKIKAICK